MTPRTGRLIVEGGVYHVLTRGNNGQAVFRHDADYRRYLELLAAYAATHDLQVRHFVLMPDHVHLIVEPVVGESLSRAMRGLNLAYTLYYQKRYRYRGHLWQGRFKSLLLEPEALLEHGRYVELHPVRSRLVTAPGDYAWSSYRTYADGVEMPPVYPHAMYERLGADALERRERYRGFVNDGVRMRAEHSRPLLLGPRRPGRPRKMVAAAAGVISLARRVFLLFVSVLALAAMALLADPVVVFSQMANGVYILRQETIASGGGVIGGGNPIRAFTALGLPAAGRASNGVFTLVAGIGVLPAPIQGVITMPVTIAGTVSDPSASVSVNGIAASVSGTTFTASGVLLSLGLNTITAVAKDAAGNTSSQSIIVYLDLPASRKAERFAIQVSGVINEPGAIVSVNGIPATVSAGVFSATVPLTSGLNTLTAIAMDAGGNSASASIRVFVPVPTSMPAMPTVGTVGPPIPTVAPHGPFTLGGTKTAGTSIWINGVEVVARNDNLTWSATVTLVEGDNEFVIIAKDASGTPSAAVTITIVVDNAPPVVTFTPPAKWNLTPALLSGQVDDHLTTVTINDITASRTGRNFQASVPLGPGVTPIILVARSPNGYTTTKSDGITLGTIPTIVSIAPADRTKPTAGAAVTLRADAADQESDPIEYRFLLDGDALVDWSGSKTASWTPSISQFGSHVITVNVRDGFGGVRTQDIRVFVVRRPVEHP